MSSALERGTTHFSVATEDGLFVSVTSTIQSGMGSAVVVPGYGKYPRADSTSEHISSATALLYQSALG